MNDVLASFRAEWLKLWHRPATWVLAILLPVLMLVLGYGIVLLEVTVLGNTHTTPANQAVIERTIQTLKMQLYPDHLVRTALGAFGSLPYGSAVGLIVGVLSYGSEFGWSTMKTIFTQRPGRLATFAGKMGALAVELGGMALLLLAAGSAAAAVLGAAYGHLTPWPDAFTFIKGFLTAWFLLGMWAALGMMLSVLFRQAALAIGLGLVYAIVVEGVVAGITSSVPSLDNVRRGFPGQNATALVASFGNGSPLLSPTQATLVTAAYLLAFLIITALLLRRDVT